MTKLTKIIISSGSWLLLKNTTLHYDKGPYGLSTINLLEFVISKENIVLGPEWLKPLQELLPNKISSL